MNHNRQQNNSLLILSAIIVGVIVALGVIWFESGSPQIGLGDSSPSASVAISTPAGQSAVTSPATLLTGDPNPSLTPGATNPDVSQANIATTICKSGWTATVRPSTTYTTPLKIQQITTYGYTDTKTTSYEEDHLISLELGGAPKDPNNLWPEPYALTYQGHDVGARIKDRYENWLNDQVCSGSMSLAVAQHDIATDWVGNWLASGAPASTATTNSDD
jgi:hypothetical protein